MPYQARAIIFSAPNEVSMTTFTLPDLEPTEVLVRAELTGISPGTEMRVLSGKQEGTKMPLIPGYTFVGTVIEAGSSCKTSVGSRVYCSGTKKASMIRVWGGHCSHAVTDESNVFIIPENVPSEQAVLTTLAAISYHGMILTDPKPHETVLVVGLGPIGQFSARLFALTGARVIAADISEDRVQSIRSSGIESVNSRDGLNAAVRAVAPEGADIVVDATGFPPVMGEAMHALRELPWDQHIHTPRRFVVQGSYPSDFMFPYRGGFSNEVRIFIPRNHLYSDVRAILDLLSRGKLDVSGLLSRVAPPEDAPQVYADLMNRSSNMITAAFRWE